MAKRRCNTCVGSGKVMGGGMMMHDCDDCDGKGKIYFEDKDDLEALAQESESYQNAVDNIVSVSSIDKEQAKVIFDKELIKAKDKKKLKIVSINNEEKTNGEK